jgi:hypothetical protein
MLQRTGFSRNGNTSSNVGENKEEKNEVLIKVGKEGGE